MSQTKRKTTRKAAPASRLTMIPVVRAPAVEPLQILEEPIPALTLVAAETPVEAAPQPQPQPEPEPAAAAPAEVVAEPQPEPVAEAPVAVEAAAPEPAAPVAAILELTTPATPTRRSAEDLVAYWDGLKRIGGVPELRDLDQSAVAASWRNSFLLSFGGPEESDAGRRKITRLGELTTDIEYTPMVIDWILSLGRRVAQARTAVQEVQSFPLTAGMTRCRAVLLPLGSRDGHVSDVLCQLSRVAESARVERRA